MASYDYGSPSPSPPPPDGRTYHQKQARMSDLLLQLRRRANDGSADRHREQQQQQVQVIKSDDNSDDLHLIAPIVHADGTTRRTHVIICKNPRRPETAYPRHHHRANAAATPYQRPEHHERSSNPRRRRSPAPQEDEDDEGATKVVCLTKMLSPGDPLEDDRFYWDFRKDVTEEARKFGHLVKVVIPRPSHEAATVVAGVGKVFLEYGHLDDAAWCRGRLDGMCYNGKEISAEFFRWAKFAAGDYE